MTPTACCPHCGSSVSAGSRFCANCGHNISAEQALVTTARLPSDAAFSATLEEEISWMLRDATLGEYDIQGVLGRGGMAIVYLAHDIALNRKVAIKVMSPVLMSQQGMIERFKREAQTAAGLNHPHIIPIHAIKETDRLLSFVMKYVPGRALDSIIDEEGALPTRMARTILSQVAGALDHAHRNGVIHRDIKPANIMIDNEGWAVVTDFGIAKPTGAEELTATGMMIGTPAYMSPEQCSDKEATGATDQYSLGVVAYEMLTGNKPFHAESLMELMRQHFFDAPAPIREVRPDCPESLARTVERMLAKDPADRWSKLADVVSAVGATPLDSDDPIRVRMVELAASGKEQLRLSRFSTPRSPIPVKVEREEAESQDGEAKPETAEPEEPPTVEVVRSAGTGRTVLLSVLSGIVVVLVAVGIAVPDVPIVGQLGIWVRGSSAGTDSAQPETAVNAVPETGSVPDDTLLGATAPAGDSLAEREEAAAQQPELQAQQRPARPTPAPVEPGTGALLLENVPEGGSVYVDDRRVQGTEVELDDGEHSVQMTAEGYESEQRQVTIQAGSSFTLRFEARRIQTPAPDPAYLVLRLRPAADVYVDGALRGEDSRRLELSLEAGVAHNIHLEAEGFAPFDTIVTFSPGDTVARSWVLRRNQ